MSYSCSTNQQPNNKNNSPEIKLVLQITVDGLRADLINRYIKNYGSGGFKFLLENGAVFTNAHYQHANTETIVGHTTLATGTYPSSHGMIGNVWFDRENKELSYNIEDRDSLLLPTRDNSKEGGQIDPAQIISRTQGRSPTAILVPTIGDTIAAYNNGKSKVFGVSGKDRSAVSMAGHTGKAFWFSTNTGDFQTSSYYYKTYPEWVEKWNSERLTDKYSGKYWNLLNESSTYLHGSHDDRPYEADLNGYGRVFPHPFGHKDDKYFYTRILVSPVIDQLILEFSKRLIINEKIAQNSVTDYLSISFSGVDAVNHFYGPSSLENEDVMLHLDRTLEKLFKFIDETIGLKHTLIVLSADHGMPDMPEYVTELGLSAGRIYSDEIIEISNKIGKKFGIDEVVLLYYRPYLYLNTDKIDSANLERTKIENAIAAELTNYDGISIAIPTNSLSGQSPNPLHKKVRNNHHLSRSGDIYVIQEPYWFLLEEGPIKAMHGSPWNFDSHVPIIFIGPGIKPEIIKRDVHPVDVAPTIANFLNITPPSASIGNVIIENNYK